MGSSPVATLRKMDINRDHQKKNVSRFETLGSRNLMEQVKGARAKVDMYFGKGLGQLVLVHSGQPVLFHLGQVLTNQRPVLGLGSDQSESSWAPYLETRTMAQ